MLLINVNQQEKMNIFILLRILSEYVLESQIYTATLLGSS